MKKIISLLLCAVLVLTSINTKFVEPTKAAEAKTYTGVPVGEQWLDTNGKHIQAHGGGFLQENGKYYWVGENKSHNSGDFYAVSLYSSTDLLNWKKEGDILTESSPTVEGAEYGLQHCKVERPKLVKNSDGTYVLYGHWEDTTNYGSSQIMVATSKNITGPYTFQGHWRPGAKKDSKYRNWRNVSDIGYITDEAYFTTRVADLTEEEISDTSNYGFGSRDLTVYTEGNTGYLISADDHSKMRIHELNDTFDDIKTIAEGGVSYNIFEGAKREAPALVKAGDGYYLIMSGQSGWFPNQALYAYTQDISDPEAWSELKVIGNNSTFYSQPTNIITIKKQDGTNEYVYMGDRWNKDALGSSTYVWLPLDINTQNHTMDMKYCPGWKLNTAIGSIELPDVINVSENKPVFAEKGVDRVDESLPEQPTYELKPEYANDGIYDMADYWSDEKKTYYGQDKVPYTWTVDLEKEYDLSRVDISYLTVGGSEGMYGYYIKGSNDNENWEVLKYNGGNRRVAFTTDKVSGKYRYVQIEVVSIVNIQNGSSVASWANGLMEVQVYADNTNSVNTQLPEISLKSGEYVGEQKASITSEAGAEIYYTTNGLQPTKNSTKYNGSITIPVGTTTLKAVAYKNGKECSATAQRTYTVYDPEAVDYSKTDLTGCVHIGDTSANLPTDISLTTYGGVSKQVKVKWDSRSFEESDMFNEVSVQGVIVGQEDERVTYTATVLPPVDEYFITCNNTDSELWSRVKEITPTMINDVADQKKESAEQTWGTVKTGNVKSKTTNKEPWNTGYYNNNGTIDYVLKLEAGKHEITVGAAGWWNNTYNLDVKYSYEGQAESSLCNVSVKGNDEGYGVGTIELDKAAEVTIKVPKVLAWLAVGNTDNQTEGETSETTSLSGETGNEMQYVIRTNNTWIDLGVWKYMFNTWNNSNGLYAGGDKADNLKLQILSSNWQTWVTQVECSFNTVPGQTYNYKVCMNSSKADGSYFFTIGNEQQFLQLLKGDNVVAGSYKATSTKTKINLMLAYVGLNVELDISQVQIYTEDGKEVTIEDRNNLPEETTTAVTQPPKTQAPTVTTTKGTQTTTKKPAAKVSVKRAKILKAVKKKKAKVAKISLKKLKGIKRYRVKVSRTKKFRPKYTRTFNVKKVKFTIKKLKPNKKYYIKVRAYKIVRGKKYYGKWSKIRKIQFKK